MKPILRETLMLGGVVVVALFCAACLVAVYVIGSPGDGH